ncbi:uncharacterized protein LOC109600699 [Aethina tumida]|uniref:uncharacterized protein LOC109600699 n=1 Tax=Aethina tumida TaxID=116153 RepID=UPI0021486C15|nr:uncharacterized protein LOC109600699 [Aethina tumida]XP_049821528.1 uncharacterized protein LOC109600699 [Aethina tumida]
MSKELKSGIDDSVPHELELIRNSKVCFGSTKHRSTLPIGKDLSPHQKRQVREEFPNISPPMYHRPNDTFINELWKKTWSNKGTGFFASNSEVHSFKMNRTPSPTRYQRTVKLMPKTQIPFPFNSAEVHKMKMSTTPGPGTYNVAAVVLGKRPKSMYNFGRPTMINSVETYCTPFLNQECHKCKELCDKDYWHKDFTLFLCHLCWLEEKNTQEIYTIKQLRLFKKFRNCSYFHTHQNTTFAKSLLLKKEMDKRRRLENYLDLFLAC